MGNTEPTNLIKNALLSKERTYAWQSRASKAPYKRILAEVKHGTRPITLETAVSVTAVLDLSLPDLVSPSSTAATPSREDARTAHPEVVLA